MLVAVGLLSSAIHWIATGGIGAGIVTSQLDGMRIPGAGQLRLQGLGGDLLGELYAEQIELVDDDGPWLTLNNVTMDWRPMALIRRTVRIESITAQEALLRRSPRTDDPPQERDGGGPNLALALEALRIDRFLVDEEFAGREEVFEIDATGDFRPGGGGALRLRIVEAEGGADSLAVDAALSAAGAVRLEAEGRGGPNGLIAALLGAPDGMPAALDATAEGDADGGDGRFALRFGADQALAGTTEWNGTSLRVNARLETARWPALTALAERMGPAASIGLEVANYRDGDAAMRLTVSSERLELTAAGPLPRDGALRETGLTIQAELADLGIWTGGAVEAETAEISGLLTQEDEGFALDGTLTASTIDAYTVQAAAMSGPLSVRQESGAIRFTAALTGANASGANPVVARLVGPSPDLTLEGAYLLENETLMFDRLALAAGQTRVEAQARIGLGPGEGLAIQGSFTDAPLSAILPDFSGRLGGRFTLESAGENTPLAITANGQATTLSGAPAPAAAVLGETLGFDLQAQSMGEVFTITRATLQGPRLRAGVNGTLSEPAGYALALEAVAQGPFPLGPAEIAGELMARGDVTGPLDAPVVSIQAFADTLDLPRAQLQRPVVDVQLRTGEALEGEIGFTAESNYGPADASLGFAQRDGVLTAPDIALRWADIRASGGVSAQPGGLLAGTVTLRKTGEPPSPWPGTLEAAIRLEESGGAQAVNVTARGADLAFPEAGVWIDNLEAAASGPFDRIVFNINADGVARGLPVRLSGDGVATGGEDGWRIETGLDADAGQVAIRAREPIVAAFLPDGRDTLRVRLIIDEDAELALDYESVTDGAMIDIRITGAPIAPMEAALREPRLSGTLDARALFDSRGGGLSGAISAALNDARAETGDRERIDMDLRGNVEDGALHGTLNMRGEGGFGARAQGALPLERQEGFIPFRVAMDAPLSGQVSANGPVDTLAALLLGLDQRLSGPVRMDAALSGTPSDPRIGGDGALTGGRFDDATSGLALRDLDIAVEFSNDEIRVTRLTANDASGGSLSGGGFARSAGGVWGGEVSAAMQNFRAVNNASAQARISGEIAARMTPDQRIIEGALVIESAEVSPPGAGTPDVLTLEVIEINVPGAVERERIRGQRGPPLELDVSLRADRRLFVRANNLDVEMSLNAHIGGTPEAIQVTGQADVVRGDADLAGRRFIFDSGRLRFNGDPMDADLDFRATRETADLIAVILVNGTPRAPRITLESQPPLPQDEILARVLFGRSVADLSALEAAQLASALASMTGGGGFDALGRLRSGLGLDRLTVGQTREGEPLISGGRYLTDDVYLEVTTGSQAGSVAQVEWQAMRNFAIISRFGTEADTSVSVRWRRTY